MKTLRHHAFLILNQFYQTGEQLKGIRDKYFAHHQLTPEERNRLLVLTNEIVRWQGRLDLWLESVLDKPLRKLLPPIHAILRLGTYELRMDTHIPDYAAIHSAVELVKQVNPAFTGLVNSVLRKLAGSHREAVENNEKKEEKIDARWYSFPEWLVQRWIQRFGVSCTRALLEYFNHPAPLDLRLDVNQLNRSELLERLDAEKIILQPHLNSDRFFRVLSGGQQLKNHPLLQTGVITIQDRGAGAIVELLDPQPGETILDVCAAPGTKTYYIAERMKNRGRIFAFDSQPQRLPERRRSLSGSGIITWEVADARTHDFPVAERILVDAPCMGTGVIGRKPDIRWRRKESMLKEMPEIQLAILKNVSQFLSPGGVLVYGTCSLEAEENWKVVNAFLKLNKHFKVEEGGKWLPAQWLGKQGALETFPPRDEVDGMFAVRLKYAC